MGVSRRGVVAAGVASVGGLLGGYYLLRSGGSLAGDGFGGGDGSGGDGSGSGDGGESVRLGRIFVENVDSDPHTLTVTVTRGSEVVAVEELELEPGVPEAAENESAYTTVSVARPVPRSWSGAGDYLVEFETEAGATEGVAVADSTDAECASVFLTVFSAYDLSTSTTECLGV